MYAKNITKAFQKHFVTDTQALGTFTAPWEKLNAETSELASLHNQFSLRITNEIERPLREFTKTHSEWQHLTMAEASCMRIAKEFDEKQAKVAKYKKTLEKVSGKKGEAAEQKLIEYSMQLESTKTAWRMEGPELLQKCQSVDQSRLEHLKQMVSAFEAIQTEIVLQIAEMSGRTSTSVAEFEPVMDMELFSSEASSNMHSLSVRDGGSITSGISYPGNGDASSIEPRRSNGTHKRGMTGGSQLSNVSFSTDISVPKSKAASMVDIQEHTRTGSNILGSTGEAPQVDSEGFSIPPPDHGPWSDAGMSSNCDDERSETSSFSQGPRMQMEIKHDTVNESNDEVRAALERVTSTLKQSKTVVRRHPGRREVRSMYQSEDSLSGLNNSFQSPPLSGAFASDRDGSSTPHSLSSPSSRVLFNSSSSHLQPSAAFTPGMSRANTLSLSSGLNNNSSIPPTPPLPLINGSGLVVPSSLAPVTSSGTGQQPPTSDQESFHPMGTSAPTSPIAATHANGGSVPGAGQERTWIVSVVEKVHAHTQAGEVVKILVTGEVILNQEGTEVNEGQPTKALLRLDHLQTLERYIPNQTYLTAVEGAEGSFWVDLEALTQALVQGQGVAVLKYQVRTTEEEARTMIPLIVQPAWRIEPKQTSLLVNYKVNMQCRLIQPTPLPSLEEQEGTGDNSNNSNNNDNNTPAQLSELSFLVPVTGEVLNAQSRPGGIWNKDSGKMLWDVDNIVMSSTSLEPHKLMARFEMNPSGAASQPNPAAVKFRVQGRLLSDVKVHLTRAPLEQGQEQEQEQEQGGQKQEKEKEDSALGSIRLQVQSGRYLAMA
ncbi:Muniscin C-terminal mu homology domain-domain-containing protein [Lobosporangium transversale]|uniref:Muniscin C-terminal mu homology domain-domain-containing protein n=1 Tax=Lobosporangium transversale TaxID=64571 RepID=A0A1Y2GH73_9FUNG|nr:Muniscin C-terminal mu homology domain-domain-containing protein [Lobosporangium transversale]ORZ10694.1 Muniscin C-terminal mu homology domain-domain-containing protein [Lobosporangium transversale]|eukprot:XP_021879415.1 Muniscin C-terminal mu homology domain-domain-containing protein [Lobosporangium transversale]